MRFSCLFPRFKGIELGSREPRAESIGPRRGQRRSTPALVCAQSEETSARDRSPGRMVQGERRIRMSLPLHPKRVEQGSRRATTPQFAEDKTTSICFVEDRVGSWEGGPGRVAPVLGRSLLAGAARVAISCLRDSTAKSAPTWPWSVNDHPPPFASNMEWSAISFGI